jgi:serine/threonine-protein kinase
VADGLLERRVALKLPHAGWVGAALAERMARERNILASLAHPNIARLYDAGIAADGRPYLALEFVEGEPIDAWWRREDVGARARRPRRPGGARGRLRACPARRASRPQALEHPGRRPGPCPPARLRHRPADRRQRGARLAGNPTLVAGRALTPDYASPEQIRGDPIGTASDIYSLGVVAYELLAGAKPYRLPKEAGAVALAEALSRVESRRSADPPPPRTRRCCAATSTRS